MYVCLRNMKSSRRVLCQILFLFVFAQFTSQRVTAQSGSPVSLQNFTETGKQVTRFDAIGDAIDAHDGEIAYFDGVYYLYGTSYDCGFEWQNKQAPFCGFKVYTSPDLMNWTDRGYLFDAQTPVWQSRCNGSTYGCFRPHVIYNQQTKTYVLWINVYDNRVGFRVFTSSAPTGPFTEVAEPTLAINSTSPVAGLNNGDHDTFVDEDGTAYLAYTDWRAKGAIVIEQLTADYLSGTGRHVNAVTKEKTEAPGLFKRKGLYYITYSDPNCGYCSGTGTAYRTAQFPLGPWSEGRRISDNSCGGQPSFVSTIKLASDSLFLYGSDLWNNGARNEALANYYWTPLEFNTDGSIKPIDCSKTPVMNIRKGRTSKPSSTSEPLYSIRCSVTGTHSERQVFRASQTGLLTSVSITAYKKDNPNAPLQLTLYASEDSATAATPLYQSSLSATMLSWSPKNRVVHPNVRVQAGMPYTLQISSTTSEGCYGLAYTEGPAVRRGQRKPINTSIQNQSIRFRTTIQKTK
ncbi:hypothetical protein C5O19_24615 [Siphonobacter curvatus]|uniref:Glycosyl hydrolase family 43 n=2 Tax=Siphonobacter curvatus TaxID=2094562 RepID=A0A2S7IF39_9BACT|nr:hypothetical protein C5O19_24615 [Siphonobacter curvatus]